MPEKKHSPFCVLEILMNDTDENHILSAKELQSHLYNQYDLDIERRTLYSNIDILKQAGFSISDYEDNQKGYFIDHPFDEAEILLLCNAIHASHFISKKQSDRLIQKLLKNLSKHQAKLFKQNVYLPNDRKTNNQELLYNISLLSEAIREKKGITFQYMHYSQDKVLTPNDKTYTMDPRYIVYAETRPYVICTARKDNQLKFYHFRIDRISRLTLSEESSEPLPRDMDAYEYAKNKLFMYGGETTPVRFLCEYRLLDQILDLLGTDLPITKYDQNHFTFRFSTSEKGAKFLAQQFLDGLQILEPESLKKEFEQSLKQSLKTYKNL